MKLIIMITLLANVGTAVSADNQRLYLRQQLSGEREHRQISQVKESEKMVETIKPIITTLQEKMQIIRNMEEKENIEKSSVDCENDLFEEMEDDEIEFDEKFVIGWLQQ